MVRQKDQPASRNAAGLRFLRWVTLAGAGIVGGMWLGQLTIGSGIWDNVVPSEESFADLSGNPDALAVDIQPQAPCFGCADDHAASARHRAGRFGSMDELLPPPGEAEDDPMLPPEFADDYEYGGGWDSEFDEPQPPQFTPMTPMDAFDLPIPLPAPVEPPDEDPPARAPLPQIY